MVAMQRGQAVPDGAAEILKNARRSEADAVKAQADLAADMVRRGKVCNAFRDAGSCARGKKCSFPHVTPEGELVQHPCLDSYLQMASDGAATLEWYIKLLFGVHFADNLA